MNDKMIERRTWDEFRSIGLLWWINRLLHLFGWAICFEYKEFNNKTNTGIIGEIYPARVKFRGFAEPYETEGFKQLSGYLKDEMTNIAKEVED